jgi:hypothetical protein
VTKVKQRRVITASIAVPAPVPTPASARRPQAALPATVSATAKPATAKPATATPPAAKTVAAKSVAVTPAPAKAPAAAKRSAVGTPRGATASPVMTPAPRRAVSARTATAARREAAPAAPAAPAPVHTTVVKRSSADVRGIRKVGAVRTTSRPAAGGSRKSPVRKVSPAKAGRRATTARGKRPVQPTAPLPREIFIKALDPLRKCGPNTSVLHMFRVDESIGGAHAATHLVFYDRHGWYCVHGRTCQAVEDVRKHGGVKQVGLDYNGRMRA